MVRISMHRCAAMPGEQVTRPCPGLDNLHHSTAAGRSQALHRLPQALLPSALAHPAHILPHEFVRW